jgi:iron donor protein CyaY
MQQLADQIDRPDIFREKAGGQTLFPCAILGAYMDDNEFTKRADHALNDLNRRLLHAADEYDFEADFNSGALSIEFEEPPGKFVVSPNSPVHRIWVSALSKSFKLDWDSAQDAFVLPASGQTLVDLVAGAIGTHRGEEVSLREV